MERRREICLEAYDSLIGVELWEVAVDGCVTKALVEARRLAEASEVLGALPERASV